MEVIHDGIAFGYEGQHCRYPTTDEEREWGPVDAIAPLSTESPFGVIREWSERSDPFRWNFDRTSRRSGETKALHWVTLSTWLASGPAMPRDLL